MGKNKNWNCAYYFITVGKDFCENSCRFVNSCAQYAENTEIDTARIHIQNSLRPGEQTQAVFTTGYGDKELQNIRREKQRKKLIGTKQKKFRY